VKYSITERLLLILLFCLTLFSCSSPEEEYKKLQGLQKSAEEIIEGTTDYDIRISSCNSVISAFQDYLGRYKSGEWSDIAKAALQSWQNRRTTWINEKNGLIKKLDKLLIDKVIEEAFLVHPMSNIKKIEISDREKWKVGPDILIKYKYAIRMRGALLGTHIFKLEVTITGKIDTKMKNVFIIGDVIVKE